MKTSWFEANMEEPTLVEVVGGTVAVFSCCGPGKEVNEDAAAVVPLEDGTLLVVADGMGGHLAGERAARAAVEILAKRLSSPGMPPRHALLDALEEANSTILDLGVGAGATLAAFLVRDGCARSFHVGDAAAIHLGQRGLIKGWTLAHSPTGYAVEAGVLDAEDALHHEDRHLVFNSLGMAEMSIEIAAPVVIAARDTLLVASDGLTDNLHPTELVDLARGSSLESAARALVEHVLARMKSAEANVPSKPDDLTFLLYRRDR